jgi:hypothetical protein
MVWYSGSWKNGEKMGFGKLFSEKGKLIYEGEWKSNKHHNKGK